MASLVPLSGTLGHRRATHLLRRASFRFTKAQVDQLAGMSASQAVSSLLVTPPLQMDQPVYDQPDTDPIENTTWLLPTGLPLPDSQGVLRRYVSGWWLHEALHDPGITHKMALFYHQFMITSILAYGNQHYFDYLRLLRWGALGNFKKLATKLVTDNTMLLYLNNHDNLKANPNENFAREFFELFTIGKGPQIGPDDYTNYTEDDIALAARVFTGFRARGLRDEYDPETGIPRGRVVLSQHDTNDKVFSDKFQNTKIVGAKTANDMWIELNAFVNMVFAQEATAKNLCRRLYRWFVSKNITQEIEDDIITPLATTLRIGNYEVKPVIKQLLQSKHFFDEDDSDNTDEILGGMIKSPLDMALQTITLFDIPLNHPTGNPRGLFYLQMSFGIGDRMLLTSGFPLFDPNDVAGYPAYYQEPIYSRQWFNSSTIIPRYKFPTKLLSGKVSHGSNPNASIYMRLDIVNWVKSSGFFSDPSDPYALVQELLAYTLPEEVNNDRFNYFYQDVFLDNLPPADWTYEWQNYLDTGNATEVKIPLEKLIQAIMYSPEFQTF
ncbi:MAG: DUF1800 family protein [Bacteroidetes bacterium]|nr:MAG: DUF1800 family protein [Bacteroidota bacterium]